LVALCNARSTREAEKRRGQAEAKMEEAEAFLAAVEPEARREEARRLDALFRRTTGWTPVMWSGIVGYGRYAYRYESGREGEWFATGFAPRKGKISVYILPGCADFGPLLARLGRHSGARPASTSPSWTRWTRTCWPS